MSKVLCKVEALALLGEALTNAQLEFEDLAARHMRAVFRLAYPRVPRETAELAHARCEAIVEKRAALLAQPYDDASWVSEFLDALEFVGRLEVVDAPKESKEIWWMRPLVWSGSAWMRSYPKGGKRP